MMSADASSAPRTRAPSVWLVASALSGAIALSACSRAQGDSTAAAPAGPASSMEAIAAIPLGDLAGAPESTLAVSMPNPYGKSPQAAQQGQELFVRMNCAGCHGYGATGGMGPNLGDTYWRYGGSPASIFKSIYEGRPQGMPAWNPALPPDEIWKLVAYIESLGGSYTAAQYQASVQGDRVGDNVAPEVKSTLMGAAAASGPSARSNSDATPSTEARPDAGGATPGGKP
jgi:cytochrome c oxidase cbb3-type subunit 3